MCNQVREAAVHAHAGVLKERLAALEGDVSALLGRHEVLTREQPWHQQHVRSLSPTAKSAWCPLQECTRPVHLNTGHRSNVSCTCSHKPLEKFYPRTEQG